MNTIVQLVSCLYQHGSWGLHIQIYWFWKYCNRFDDYLLLLDTRLFCLAGMQPFWMRELVMVTPDWLKQWNCSSTCWRKPIGSSNITSSWCRRWPSQKFFKFSPPPILLSLMNHTPSGFMFFYTEVLLLKSRLWVLPCCLLIVIIVWNLYQECDIWIFAAFSCWTMPCLMWSLCSVRSLNPTCQGPEPISLDYKIWPVALWFKQNMLILLRKLKGWASIGINISARALESTF